MKYADEASLPEITEERFQENLQKSQPYTVLILRVGPKYEPPGPNRSPALTAILKAHGKRNMALRAAGILPVVCPIGDGSGVTGIGIFDASPEEVQRIYSLDPGVQAGLFTFEVHPCRSFPGSALPGAETAH